MTSQPSALDRLHRPHSALPLHYSSCTCTRCTKRPSFTGNASSSVLGEQEGAPCMVEHRSHVSLHICPQVAGPQSRMRRALEGFASVFATCA